MAKNKNSVSSKKAKIKQRKQSEQQRKKKVSPILIAFLIVVLGPLLPGVLISSETLGNGKLEYMCEALAKQSYPDWKIKDVKMSRYLYDNYEYALQRENPNREDMDGFDYEEQKHHLMFSYDDAYWFERKWVSVQLVNKSEGEEYNVKMECAFRSKIGYMGESMVFDTFTDNGRRYPSYAVSYHFTDIVDYLRVSSNYYIKLDEGLWDRWMFIYRKVTSIFR